MVNSGEEMKLLGIWDQPIFQLRLDVPAVYVATITDHFQCRPCTCPAAGFGSKNKYLFGNIGMQIKLVGNDSAGTVTCFYVSLNLKAFNSGMLLQF